MGFQDDWIMRQIDMVSRFVAKLIFNKDEIGYQPESSEMLSETDRLHLRLDGLIREGRIGEAEDLLFDNAVFSDKYVELASDFYKRLNSLTDKELEAGGFSRDEVFDGYIEILTRLGVPVEQFVN